MKEDEEKIIKNNLKENNDIDNKLKKFHHSSKPRHENEPFTKLRSRMDVDFIKVDFLMRFQKFFNSLVK